MAEAGTALQDAQLLPLGELLPVTAHAEKGGGGGRGFEGTVGPLGGAGITLHVLKHSDELTVGLAGGGRHLPHFVNKAEYGLMKGFHADALCGPWGSDFGSVRQQQLPEVLEVRFQGGHQAGGGRRQGGEHHQHHTGHHIPQPPEEAAQKREQHFQQAQTGHGAHGGVVDRLLLAALHELMNLRHNKQIYIL